MGQVIEEKVLTLFGGTLGWVDLIYAVALFWGAAGGLRNGLKGEIGKVLAAWVALVLAMRYSASLAEWITDRTAFPYEAGEGILFMTITLGVYFMGDLTMAFSGKIAHVEFFSVLNRIGGVLLGMARVTLLGLALSRVVLIFPAAWLHDSFYERSYTGIFLGQGAELVYGGLQSVIPVENVLPRPWEGGSGAPPPPAPPHP